MQHHVIKPVINEPISKVPCAGKKEPSHSHNGPHRFDAVRRTNRMRQLFQRPLHGGFGAG